MRWKLVNDSWDLRNYHRLTLGVMGKPNAARKISNVQRINGCDGGRHLSDTIRWTRELLCSGDDFLREVLVNVTVENPARLLNLET